MQGKDSDRLDLNHILECIENIEQDTQGDKQRLLGSRTVRDAALRNLQILSESTQRLSD